MSVRCWPRRSVTCTVSPIPGGRAVGPAGPRATGSRTHRAPRPDHHAGLALGAGPRSRPARTAPAGAPMSRVRESIEQRRDDHRGTSNPAIQGRRPDCPPLPQALPNTRQEPTPPGPAPAQTGPHRADRSEAPRDQPGAAHPSRPPDRGGRADREERNCRMRPPRPSSSMSEPSRRSWPSGAGRSCPAWPDAVEADDLPELRSLAIGMRRDLPASSTASRWNTAPVLSRASSRASSGSSATATGERNSTFSDPGYSSPA